LAVRTAGLGLECPSTATTPRGKHRIIVAAIKYDEFEGIRVAPGVYTTPDEIDRFCEAIEGVLEKGVPTA
jgi:selenocysteine lyase/cysteine desulfurase